MDNEFKDFRKKINDYFLNITDKQLKADVEKAGYSFYKNIKAKIFREKEVIKENNIKEPLIP